MANDSDKSRIGTNDGRKPALASVASKVSAVPIQPVETNTALEPDEEGGFTFFEMLSTLPEPVQNYLLSAELDKVRIGIFDRLKLSLDDRDIALYTELEVFFGDVNLADYPDELWTNLPWEDKDKARAQELARETVGRIFLPARTFLGGVAELLESVGGQVGDYPTNQIESRVVTYGQAAQEIAAEADLPDFNEASLRRLQGIIESRLRGVRSDADTVVMLTKPSKTGGLEMSAEDADWIVALTVKEMKWTNFVDQLPNTAADAKTEDLAAELKYPPEEIRRLLAGTAEEQKTLALAAEHLDQFIKGNDGQLKERLHDIVYDLVDGRVETWDVVAALMLLTKRGLLLETLAKDLRFGQAVRSFSEEKGRDRQFVEAFRLQPSGPQAVNVFLQLVLCGVAGLSDGDAARYGLRITNMLKKAGQSQYSGLVAFDLDEGEFVWTEPMD
ncbi:hypothetical protein COY93_02910 [Candidatus Uhrbacteria bacterium CG_4_10_14_0_8_um_filter_58_22]|uniref:Uncharacterized protein n=1 Tax=Candidatus Uhrbacteria bacterium CG_4_10_14_0_8_um_filter_58_22 TaxID=1975029 RepID=A0A2M7Q9P3_9BACT|nr:MAG: hypothetical protein AUJ19_04600 [Parcubacteria group bacterium CG1_02_58_44]PIY62471.1 MAG: hypothetical protein COY93_02910 [Candidatus Uhrbacteria bacterium CG_4_10_14_0_8_um_filter_58_22]